MAEISITVGPLTVKRTAPDAQAQTVLLAAYEKLAYIFPAGEEPTSKEKLELLLKYLVGHIIDMAGEMTILTEQTAHQARLTELSEQRIAERELWAGPA